MKQYLTRVFMVIWNLFALAYIFGVILNVNYTTAAIYTMYFVVSFIFVGMLINTIYIEVYKWNLNRQKK
jgi:hypothetical protein